MRKLDNWFPDFDLCRYRVSISDPSGESDVYYFYAVDCAGAVERLDVVSHDYPDFTVRFDTLHFFDDFDGRWLKCVLWPEESEEVEYAELTDEDDDLPF